jgi:D-alanine---D-serine ligase
MIKLKIAVIFGGCSSEYSVSLESAYSVINSIDSKKYIPILIGITKKGDWYYFNGDIDNIKNDTWCNEKDSTPVILSPNHGANEILILNKKGWEKEKIDLAFPILHGKNGEDGRLQGLIELAGIPLVGCGTLASALCMDKDYAHKLAKDAGIMVPKAKVFSDMVDFTDISDFSNSIGYPIFIKPLKAGSSYGVSKVQDHKELQEAVDLAFQYDNQIIIEENIDGFEVGCAIMGNQKLEVGELDEIELSGGFFDFTEKYTLKTSAIHVPARISHIKAEEIKQAAKKIYYALGCSVFARIDLFLTPLGEIVFNEVNTIPGFTEHSRYPGMMKAAGISFPEVINGIIQLAIEKGMERMK